MHVTRRLNGKHGLEVGGPSSVFRRFRQWPIYGRGISLDNLDFATHTIWSHPNKHSQYRSTLIGEAATLDGIGDRSYAFLVSSHVLEHIANPIGALLNWRRVVAAKGLIIAVAPHSEATFDRRRPITTIEHMWLDYIESTTERDATHMAEVLSLHDWSRDPGLLNRERFVERICDNWRSRSMHHHVVVTETLVRLFDLVGLRVLYVDTALPHHICVVGEVPEAITPLRFEPGVLETVSNQEFLDDQAKWRRRSPFRADRMSFDQQ